MFPFIEFKILLNSFLTLIRRFNEWLSDAESEVNFSRLKKRNQAWDASHATIPKGIESSAKRIESKVLVSKENQIKN